MAAKNLLANEYSDHTLLSQNKINQLNVAQLGRLQIFPGNIPNTFTWSSTLRTGIILMLLAQKKSELEKLGYRLLAHVNNSNLTLEQKNSIIETESNAMIKDLQELGFSVKAFTMFPNKFFNPNVSPNLLRQNPNDYVKGPAFVLEDTDSFMNRMSTGFKVMLGSDADIVCAQEVEFGESDGFNFSKIHETLMTTHNSYDFSIPPIV